MLSFQNKDGLKSQTILDAVGTPPNTARPTTQRNMSPVRMEFGQSQEAPMTVVSTPTNNMSADKLVMDKATRRAVERNLDSLVATPQKGPNTPKNTGNRLNIQPGKIKWKGTGG